MAVLDPLALVHPESMMTYVGEYLLTEHDQRRTETRIYFFRITGILAVLQTVCQTGTFKQNAEQRNSVVTNGMISGIWETEDWLLGSADTCPHLVPLLIYLYVRLFRALTNKHHHVHKSLHGIRMRHSSSMMNHARRRGLFGGCNIPLLILIPLLALSFTFEEIFSLKTLLATFLSLFACST